MISRNGTLVAAVLLIAVILSLGVRGACVAASEPVAPAVVAPSAPPTSTDGVTIVHPAPLVVF